VSNVGNSYMFRLEAAAYLQLRGLAQTVARPIHRSLAQQFIEGQDHGDLLGLGPWAIEVRNERTMDLSGAMNTARDEATQAGATFYAAVHRRRGHSVSDAYVTMPLSQLASLLVAGLPPQLPVGSDSGVPS
jgi:hypothetical protein